MAFIPLEEIEQLYNRMEEPYPGIRMTGKMSPRFLRNAKGLIPGSVAPEIEGTDINGKIFCLENLKGKYIILDF
ncbi:MAG: hypothetical protein ACLU4J_04585 [Butyricimonas paravirosa]